MGVQDGADPLGLGTLVGTFQISVSGFPQLSQIKLNMKPFAAGAGTKGRSKYHHTAENQLRN